MRRGLVCVMSAAALALAGCGGGGGAVTAQEVSEAFEEAGLPMTDARDNSDGCSTPEVCTSRITTEDVSVYGYDSVEDAQNYAETAGEGYHQNGPIVLGYVGADTPEDLQVQYEEALADLLAE
ncbi:hypothetical protein [Nocardiopsis lucentensis]|uniref:hypothetical protein n=1 Tax=Nocardiopsis lucentensis TaxID=53441 RepID=UPI0003465430|nr:hypothetical protein [Nocardiopsis lucentensis]